MDRLLRLGGAMPQAAPPTDAPVVDTAEQVYISSLALLKMLKHGRAGVPMEVMGLMLGEFVDDYTVQVIDVFAMPQTGTGVSVEAVDPVFQAKMLDMLKQTGRPEMVVGWYHSHPGFGCWLSGVDINTQQSFEALSERAVAVVVDPIQSVKGKVVIDAFRLINPNMLVLGQEPRQTTSNLGHLQKPSVQALIHGLNRHYYSISINYRKNELEQKMLLNLHKKSWKDGLTLADYNEHCSINEDTVAEMLDLAKNYNKVGYKFLHTHIHKKTGIYFHYRVYAMKFMNSPEFHTINLLEEQSCHLFKSSVTIICFYCVAFYTLYTEIRQSKQKEKLD